MWQLSPRKVKSSNGERVVAPRSDLLSSQSSIRPLNIARSMSSTQLLNSNKFQHKQLQLNQQQLNTGTAPGLYFSAIATRPNTTLQLERSKSGFVFSEQNQKLFSPYEYLHYATKISGSKDTYLNSLEQLGFNEAQQFHSRPLNEIINNTSTIIRKSYSMKYMGIIDGNMGILSNRKRIQPCSSPSPLDHHSLTDLSPLPTETKKINDHQQQHQQQSSYLVGSYSLPRGLKSMRSKRDPTVIADKLKLEKWHAQQIKIMDDPQHYPEKATPTASVPQPSETITKRSKMMSQLIQEKGMSQLSQHAFLSTRVSPHNQSYIGGGISDRKEMLKSSVYKKPLKNYEEDSDGVCYAIIDTNSEDTCLSYSKLLGQINKKDPASFMVQAKKKYLSKKDPQDFKSITYQQNQLLFDRFEAIQGKAMLKESENRK